MRKTLPIRLPSVNELRTKRPPHGSGRYLNTAWRRYFERELGPPNAGERMKGPVAVTVTRLMGPREREFDDFNEGIKPLVDALRTCGYIESDAPKMCRQSVNQERGKGAAKIVIVMERLA